MFKIILLFVVLWLAVRLVGRIVRYSYLSGQSGRNEHNNRRSSSGTTSGRTAVEEAEFEVIDTQIRKNG
jgi:hypothetical protein